MARSAGRTVAALMAAVLLCGTAEADLFRIEVEGGPAWSARNDVRIPNEPPEGTRFSIHDLGNGPYASYRAALEWDIDRRHGLRLLVAPFEYSETGSFERDILFDGVVFDGGIPLDATYRFDSYRLTYRYRLVDSERWQVRLGITAKIRDAEIELQQDGRSHSYTDTGFVPLLHADVQYTVRDATRLVFTGDFLAAPQGRATDVALLIRHSLSELWDVSAGYRTLEGGADNDDVYTMAWFHYAVVQVGRTFGSR